VGEVGDDGRGGEQQRRPPRPRALFHAAAEDEEEVEVAEQVEPAGVDEEARQDGQAAEAERIGRDPRERAGRFAAGEALDEKAEQQPRREAPGQPRRPREDRRVGVDGKPEPHEDAAEPREVVQVVAPAAPLALDLGAARGGIGHAGRHDRVGDDLVEAGLARQLLETRFGETDQAATFAGVDGDFGGGGVVRDLQRDAPHLEPAVRARLADSGGGAVDPLVEDVGRLQHEEPVEARARHHPCAALRTDPLQIAARAGADEQLAAALADEHRPIISAAGRRCRPLRASGAARVGRGSVAGTGRSRSPH